MPSFSASDPEHQWALASVVRKFRLDDIFMQDFMVKMPLQHRASRDRQRECFYGTDQSERILAIVIALRDAAMESTLASALLHRTGQLAVETQFRQDQQRRRQ